MKKLNAPRRGVIPEAYLAVGLSCPDVTLGGQQLIVRSRPPRKRAKGLFLESKGNKSTAWALLDHRLLRPLYQAISNADVDFQPSGLHPKLLYRLGPAVSTSIPY